MKPTDYMQMGAMVATAAKLPTPDRRYVLWTVEEWRSLAEAAEYGGMPGWQIIWLYAATLAAAIMSGESRDVIAELSEQLAIYDEPRVNLRAMSEAFSRNRLWLHVIAKRCAS